MTQGHNCKPCCSWNRVTSRMRIATCLMCWNKIHCASERIFPPLPCSFIDVRWVPEQVGGRDDVPRRRILCISESDDKADIPRRSRHSTSPACMGCFIEAAALEVTITNVLFVVVYDLFSVLNEEVLLVKYC